jgi:3-hydroxyacyl-CoA dehydrogenase
MISFALSPYLFIYFVEANAAVTMRERMLTGYFLGPRRYLSLLGIIQGRSTERQIVKTTALTLLKHTFGNVLRRKGEVQRSVTLYIGRIRKVRAVLLLAFFLSGPFRA